MVASRKVAHRLFHSSLSRVTVTKYRFGQRLWRAWKKLNPGKTTWQTVRLFVTDCRLAGLRFGPVNLVRSAILMKAKEKGRQDHPFAHPAIRQILSGYQKLDKSASEETRPIFRSSLAAMLEQWRHSIPGFAEIRASLVLSFQLLLRIYDLRRLAEGRNSLTIRRDGAVLLKCATGKGDRQRQGELAFFPAGVFSDDELLDLRHCVDAIRLRGVADSQRLNALLREYLKDNSVHLHCLRHGRCTELLLLGWSRESVRGMGRWRSIAAMLVYFHPDSVRRRAPKTSRLGAGKKKKKLSIVLEARSS